MKFTTGKPVTIEQLYETVKSKFPQYAVTLKRNKVLRFSYVEVKKSALIGSWIRLTDNKVTLLGAIPSVIIRAFFGGLILIAFISGKLKKLRGRSRWLSANAICVNKFLRFSRRLGVK